MLVYVAHSYNTDSDLEKAKRITRDLQISKPENTYVCPLIALSHLTSNDMAEDERMELKLDILSVCDMVILASEVTNDILKEINLAKLVDMEVVMLEKNGALRPFKK